MSPKNKSERGYKNRPVNTREIPQRFLIVCEGEKTEPNYFRNFRVPKEVIDIDIRGAAYNTVSLVNKTIKIKEKENDYDQVWCVFDKDDFPPQNFDQAIKLAKQHDIQVAYSNEAFEIWYILHFCYRDTAMSRQDYQNALTEQLKNAGLLNQKEQYKKNRDDMYEKLKALQPTAIKNAIKLLNQYSPANPAYDNPSTTVHLLVEQLNRFIR